MLYTFVRFRNAAEIAWITTRLYDSREEGDVITEARLYHTVCNTYWQSLYKLTTAPPLLYAYVGYA
jgi:hypothetical protein